MSILNKLRMMRQNGWWLFLTLAACESSVSVPEIQSGRIMFANSSAYLTDMLNRSGGRSHILIDGSHPGITVDPDDPTKSISPPLFVGTRGEGQIPTSMYYPYSGNSANAPEQYWIQYMRLTAGEHRFQLLDTVNRVLLDTALTLDLHKPLSIFFADSATQLSAVALEHDETVTSGKARLRLLNLIPDTGAVRVAIAGADPLTEELDYLKATSYIDYAVPDGGRLYITVYAKADDTDTPLMRGSVRVQSDHNYLLVLKGYTKPLQLELPGDGQTIIPANPWMDVINTL